MAESLMSKYKRQPKLQIDLPSKGSGYSQGTLGKFEGLDVYSMTAGDEIGIKTPDTLFSGSATVKVIESCIPDIKNGWQIPLNDLYTILSAIRMATSGETTTLTSACPNCSEVNDYEIYFNNIIEHYQSVSFITEIRVDNVIINTAPLSYKDLTEINKQTFKLQRQLAQKIPNIEDETERDAETQKLFDQLSNLQSSAVIHTVKSIEIDDFIEQDWNKINEFIKNADSKIYDALLETHLENMSNFELPNNKLQCPSCSHEYETASEFDWSSFFETR